MDTPSLVSQKLSDSGRYIQLHPLVLLTISDHLTRHTARQQQGPVLGALLGQQNGQEITLEHAFECFTTTGSDGEIRLPDTWFEQRLQQCQYILPRTRLHLELYHLPSQQSRTCTKIHPSNWLDGGPLLH